MKKRSAVSKRKIPSTPKVKNFPQGNSPSFLEKDMPVTQDMFFLFRDEMNFQFNSVNHQFTQSEAKMDSRFDLMDAKFSKLLLLVEQQNARNNVVLDGLAALNHRQTEVESKVQNLESLVFEIKSVR